MLEKLRQFLLGFSGWDEEPSIDHGEDGPGQTGLFPDLQEEVARRKDLLGNIQTEMRCKFILYRRLRPGQDGAQWLLDFRQWLGRQEARGVVPGFGDVPALEKLRVLKGDFKRIPQLGEGLCTVVLAAEFVKNYKAGEDGQ